MPISDSAVNLKQEVFIKMPIPLCSIQEQNEIVQEIESRLSVTNNLDKRIAKKNKSREIGKRRRKEE